MAAHRASHAISEGLGRQAPPSSGTPDLVVREGKGAKDRVTRLPAAVKAALARHLEGVRPQHERDLLAGAGWVELPVALGRKCPSARRQWACQWVFPATRLYFHRETRQKRRHHLHESVVQRAVKEAVRRSGIAKRATCHTFTHSFATHLLEDGYDIRPGGPFGRPCSRCCSSWSAWPAPMPPS